MRSPGGAPEAGKTAAASGAAAATRPARPARPPLLLLAAAAALWLEAAGLCVAIVANAIDSVNGDTYNQSNGIALMVLEFIVAAGVALVASGVARVRPWSRTPALMINVFTAMIAFWLLEAHRYAWGTPALLFAVAGLAGLLTPASLSALRRPAGTTAR